jgi:hypothetical protein
VAPAISVRRRSAKRLPLRDAERRAGTTRLVARVRGDGKHERVLGAQSQSYAALLSICTTCCGRGTALVAGPGPAPSPARPGRGSLRVSKTPLEHLPAFPRLALAARAPTFPRKPNFPTNRTFDVPSTPKRHAAPVHPCQPPAPALPPPRARPCASVAIALSVASRRALAQETLARLEPDARPRWRGSPERSSGHS